ncbi:autotransporter domain-containing protein, partial [Xanthobacter oligotrophicus]
WDGAITTNSGTITNYLGAKWVNGAVGSNLIGAVITNDGIGTEWTGDITSNAGAVYNQNGAKWDGAITTNSGTITNYLGAKWVNGAVGSNLIGAVITNDGAGTEWTGDITSNAGAVYNQNGAKWDGAITTNSGTIINALGAKWVNGAVGSNLIGAVITNDGLGTEWTGDITSNAGAVYNQDHATWTGDVAANSIGALIVNDNATWNGSVSNDGTIHNQNHAVWTGDVKKNTSNTSIVNDNSTWNGNVLANTGTIWNQNTAIWNGDVLTNDGHINNTLDSNWNGNVVSNNAAGVITNDGAGTEWTGAITSNAGAVYNQNGAIWHGDVTDNVGTIVTTSTWDGSITNSNYLRAEGAITKFVVNNAGATTKVAGNLDVGGNFTNAGLVDMSDGTKTYQTLKVGMNFAGTGASTVAMDIDLSSGNVSGPRADVVVAGSISGSTNLQFQSVGTKGLFGQEITVAEGASAANAFSTTTLGSNGLVDYNLKQDGSKWVVTSSLNPSAGSIAGTVAASLMTITTGFLESTSAFVSGPADPVRDQISYGLWTRVKAGSYNVDNVSTTQVVGASSAVSEAGTFKSNFNGFQVGADVSRSDMGGSGWTGHVGLTAGDVWLDNTLQNYAGVSSQVEAPFFGAYAALVGHGLFADVQVQRNIYNIDLTNTQALLMSSPTNADGWTVVASAGGVIPFAETWFVEPSVGLNYATASVDNVLLPGGSGVIKTDTIDSLIGSLRLRMGTSFTAGPNLVLRPSVQASVWHEFAGDGGGLYDDGQGGAAIIGISNIGTFGQVGVGLSAQALDTGVLGFIRADYRFGENIDGGSFTGGLRKQF